MKQCVCKKKNTQLPLKKSNFFGFCSSTYLLPTFAICFSQAKMCFVGKLSKHNWQAFNSMVYNSKVHIFWEKGFPFVGIFWTLANILFQHQGLNSEHLLTKGDAFCLLTLDTTTFVLQCIRSRESYGMALKLVQQPIYNFLIWQNSSDVLIRSFVQNKCHKNK